MSIENEHIFYFFSYCVLTGQERSNQIEKNKITHQGTTQTKKRMSMDIYDHCRDDSLTHHKQEFSKKSGLFYER